MEDATINIDHSTEVIVKNTKKRFSVNVDLFFLLLIGLHLFFKVMDWGGEFGMLIILPTFYAAFYFIRALILLWQYHFYLSLIALCVSVLFILIGIKLEYTYHHLLLALSLIAIGTILIRKSLRQLGADKKFKNKLYHLISVVLLMQFIPNSVLFKYYNYPHILWGKKLAWKDFQASPNTTSVYSAEISTTFFYKVNKIYDYPQAMVITRMNPQESWCKPKDTTGIYGRFLLDHEQVHFDITEVWKRKTTDSLWRVWGRNHQQIDSIISYYYKQERKMQIQYDTLTQHGTDSLTQVKWSSLIRNQLNE